MQKRQNFVCTYRKNTSLHHGNTCGHVLQTQHLCASLVETSRRGEYVYTLLLCDVAMICRKICFTGAGSAASAI